MRRYVIRRSLQLKRIVQKFLQEDMKVDISRIIHFLPSVSEC